MCGFKSNKQIKNGVVSWDPNFSLFSSYNFFLFCIYLLISSLIFATWMISSCSVCLKIVSTESKRTNSILVARFPTLRFVVMADVVPVLAVTLIDGVWNTVDAGETIVVVVVRTVGIVSTVVSVKSTWRTITARPLSGLVLYGCWCCSSHITNWHMINRLRLCRLFFSHRTRSFVFHIYKYTRARCKKKSRRRRNNKIPTWPQYKKYKYLYNTIWLFSFFGGILWKLLTSQCIFSVDRLSFGCHFVLTIHFVPEYRSCCFHWWWWWCYSIWGTLICISVILFPIRKFIISFVNSKK